MVLLVKPRDPMLWGQNPTLHSCVKTPDSWKMHLHDASMCAVWLTVGYRCNTHVDIKVCFKAVFQKAFLG